MNKKHHLTPTIQTITEQNFIGLSMQMSVADNKTATLWSTLGPKIKEIKNVSANYKVSLQEYPLGYFKNFNPQTSFKKWALIPVSNTVHIPDNLESYRIPQGLYALFAYKGNSNDSSIYQYIFTEWLPKSGYILDDRPHFEVLDEKYKNNHPDSEEVIYIPIKLK